MGAARLVLANLAQALGDGLVRRIELKRALIRVDRVCHLIVARLVQRPEVEPHLCEVWVDPDRTRVGVERVVKLVDVVVKDTDRTPERRVLAVAVHGLLVRLVSFAEVVGRHVCSSEEVPREWIVRVYSGKSSVSGRPRCAMTERLTRFKRLCQDLHRNFGSVERRVRSMVETAKLLQNFRVCWVLLQDSLVRFFRGDELRDELRDTGQFVPARLCDSGID